MRQYRTSVEWKSRGRNRNAFGCKGQIFSERNSPLSSIKKRTNYTMGLFGKSSKVAADSTDAYHLAEQGSLPVAVAVSPEAEPAKIIPTQQQKTVVNESKQTAVAPTHYKFTQRTPTVVPMCRHCNARNVRTRIRTAPHFLTLVAIVILAFIFWPICWIPLVLDSCRRTTHSCSHCNAELGHIECFQDCCVKHR